jgi:hypothetical protein
MNKDYCGCNECRAIQAAWEAGVDEWRPYALELRKLLQEASVYVLDAGIAFGGGVEARMLYERIMEAVRDE